MLRINVGLYASLLVIWSALPVLGQSAAAGTSVTVPQLVNFSGALIDAKSEPLTGVVGITFCLYKEPQGGAPVWMETQNVQADSAGHYTAALGSSSNQGLPAGIFASGEARWLAVQAQGQAEQPRILLMSVPYALKAADAETVGGIPASAFLLAAPRSGVRGGTGGAAVTAKDGSPDAVDPAITGTGTADFIPKWTTKTHLGNSAIFQASSTNFIGIGTTSPATTLEVDGTAAFAANSAGQSVTVTQSNTSGLGLVSTAPVEALVGNATGFIAGGIGVQGNALYTGGGTTYGVEGNAASSGGIGVYGTASGSAGIAVQGYIVNTTGSTATQIAVEGVSNDTSASPIGVQGQIASPTGIGVKGISVESTGTGTSVGVLGISPDNNGVGVEGLATNTSGTSVPIGVLGESSSSTGVGILGDATSSSGSTFGIKGIAASAAGIGVQGTSPGIGIEGITTAAASFPIGVHGATDSSVGAAGVFDTTARTLQGGCVGNILIGRSVGGLLGEQFEVFRVDCTGKGYFDNGTQTGGADFAESVTVRGDRAQYAPGDLLAIDSRGKRRLTLSQQAYSTRIAGIYSTKPGVLATPHKMEDAQLAQEVPLAVVGIVPCKVTAENGRIEVGDLLVASSRPGYAMKGTNRRRMLGAVVGKAMEPLQSSTGVIEVLVTLQ
jgi:hypothetical protein